MRHGEIKSLRKAGKKILAWLKTSNTACDKEFTIPQLQTALKEWLHKEHSLKYLFWQCGRLVEKGLLVTSTVTQVGVAVKIRNVHYTVTPLGLGVGTRILAFARDGVDGFDILPAREMVNEAAPTIAPADIPIPAPSDWSTAGLSTIAEMGARLPLGQPS